MELIPAIDIIDGKCVRLTKGDYGQKNVYGDPLEMALNFERIGFRRLHVVDLDGAKSKILLRWSLFMLPPPLPLHPAVSTSVWLRLPIISLLSIPLPTI